MVEAVFLYGHNTHTDYWKLNFNSYQQAVEKPRLEAGVERRAYS
ncbi:MAG: hypothetical protein ACKVLB_05255 [Burkholderiales bacterium]|jgi:hypothetical protein